MADSGCAIDQDNFIEIFKIIIMYIMLATGLFGIESRNELQL